MSKKEASIRRDFVFNAMGFDPLTNTLFDGNKSEFVVVELDRRIL